MEEKRQKEEQERIRLEREIKEREEQRLRQLQEERQRIENLINDASLYIKDLATDISKILEPFEYTTLLEELINCQNRNDLLRWIIGVGQYADGLGSDRLSQIIGYISLHSDRNNEDNSSGINFLIEKNRIAIENKNHQELLNEERRKNNELIRIKENEIRLERDKIKLEYQKSGLIYWT